MLSQRRSWQAQLPELCESPHWWLAGGQRCGAEIYFFQQFRRVSRPLLFSVTYAGCITGLVLSKRCLIPTAHIVSDCWEGSCWDQATCWNTWCLRRGDPGCYRETWIWLPFLVASPLAAGCFLKADSALVRGLGTHWWVRHRAASGWYICNWGV